MANWVPQNEFSSVTAAARGRTAYLASLQKTVWDAIEEYLSSEPDGEQVTLAVLKTIGKVRLEDFSADRSFDRVKQDIGLLVAQSLVDLYGANRVHTLRRDDRKSVSNRRNSWGGLDWVGTYAPHRVLTAGPAVERILLDTSVIRKVVHGDPDALDLAALKELKGDHPVSVANGALAELAMQLLRGSITTKDWAARIGALDTVLDPDFPVAPGGKELSALWGAHSPVGFDVDESRSFYWAAWDYLRNVKTAADLSLRGVFHGASGHAYTIRLDREYVEAVLADEGKNWAEWVVQVAGLIGGLREDGDTITEELLQKLMLSNLCLDMALADAIQLDLVVHIVARRAIEASRGSTPYNPKGKSNDPLDLDLLFGIPLPGWVCTADERLHQLVHSTKSRDKDKVMTAAELLARLGAEASRS